MKLLRSESLRRYTEGDPFPREVVSQRQHAGSRAAELQPLQTHADHQGLRSETDQYGARDFVTIQPYLQHLPRDYPIRVLSAALAYRLWRRGGLLPPYEDGANALHIQSVGIPGLSAAKS